MTHQYKQLPVTKNVKGPKPDDYVPDYYVQYNSGCQRCLLDTTHQLVILQSASMKTEGKTRSDGSWHDQYCFGEQWQPGVAYRLDIFCDFHQAKTSSGAIGKHL